MPDQPQRTLLFGGLTRAHHACLTGALESLGYRAQALPVPDNQDLAVGRQYGNRGWCNPAYYTVGNLVRFLQGLRAAGEEGIGDRYAFLTAGSCGPCRFGMYADAYRKAFRENDLARFPIILIDQVGGLRQDGGASWVRMDRRFFVRLLRAIMVGDLLNELAARIRPYETYETEAGATDRALEAALILAEVALRRRDPIGRMLRAARDLFDQVPVDYLQVKPVVKVTGEFWAQTTEGDGNYRLFEWLEQEGAEVRCEPVATWIDYTIWLGLDYLHARTRIARRAGGIGVLTSARLRLGLRLAQRLFRATYGRYRRLLGGRTDPLPSQRWLAARARPYYSPDLRGGEGHVEVGKHVHAFTQRRAHLVLSVKPFGCMPSTMSDGVQYKVLDDFPGSLFLPVETTGDGEVSVKSRIQMVLFEARVRARREFDEALAAAGLTVEEARRRAPARGLLRATARLPHCWVGTAANVVAAVGRGARHRPAGSAFETPQSQL